MKGLTGTEWEAMQAFMKLKQTHKDVTPRMLTPEHAAALTRIYEEYSRGFIACEMTRAQASLQKEANV